MAQPFRAWFVSTDPRYPERYPLDSILYRCPHSGELLEVRHDLDALRQKSAQEWRELFDRRWRSRHAIDASGVWGKREWVLP
ncbi:MAG: threonine synthase, partial [Leptospiraceae bacterium]|nr:threonine synthase [Leptospiraceae bacterium]